MSTQDLPRQRIHPQPQKNTKTVFSVLWAASFCHLLNDMLQALLPAVYPILQGNFELTFAQVGFLTFIYQITASLFSLSSATIPIVGPCHIPCRSA